ncbi:uncharacterized [Tachysurus ichikawai]
MFLPAFGRAPPAWVARPDRVSDQRHEAYKRRLSESVCGSYFWQRGRGPAGCEEGGLAETKSSVLEAKAFTY